MSIADYQKSKKNEMEANRLVKLEIENLLKELKLIKYQSNESKDLNDYYDQENENNKISKAENDKLNAMAINLKELLFRLLEKRKQGKRNILAEVRIDFFLICLTKIIIKFQLF
jgi:hypothetical protein